MPIGHYVRKVKPDSWYLDKIRSCGLGKTDSDCWDWNGRLGGSGGYGYISYKDKGGKSKDIGVHRLSLMLRGVDIPKGFVVMHTCDNPKCVNPSHLKVATQAENRRDCAKKGRAASGDDNGMRKHPEKSFFNTADSWRHARGEEHGMAKLTDTQCAEIRDSYKGERGELTRLAERYGVSRPHIARIVKNQARKNPS